MGMRILHVVGGMNRAGTETWLMNVVEHVDRRRFKMDFLVHSTTPGAYDKRLRALGCRLIVCPTPSRPLTYARNLKRLLRDNGPYDVVHSHVRYYSGWVLKVARAAGVPVRIAHSHSDTSQRDARASLARRVYLRLCERWIRNCATLRVACSRDAAVSLFGPDWHGDANTHVLQCGIDLTPFRSKVDRATVRAELGIATDAVVLGHVGRFHHPKNHSFLLEIAAEAAKREPQVVLLLVGDGLLRRRIEEKAISLGIRDRVIFTGVRADIHRLMPGAMDSFVFPSLHEGLGLVLVEAQAAGLPCIISDVVPREADIVLPLIRRVSLSASPAAWADAVLENRNSVPVPPQAECLRLVEQSSFNINASVAGLEELYGGTSRKST